MFTNIPRTRIILYITLLGLAPIVLGIFNFMAQSRSVEALQEELSYIEQFAAEKKRWQANNDLVQKHFKDADHFYIDKNLETLKLLKPEVETLKQIVDNKYFAGDENIKKRLEQLSGPSNAIRFSEESVSTYPPGKNPVFQETTASLAQRVELNLSDLKQLLSLIEGEPIGSYQPAPNRPQFIVLDFRIDKKEVSKSSEVFQLSMKILKREFL